MIRTNLANLTEAEHQHDIDVMLQSINEVLAELVFYGVLDFRLKSGTITLATSTSAYELPTSFTGFHVPYLSDLTNNQYITRYKGSYKDYLDYTTLNGQQVLTGQPLYFVESGLGDSYDATLGGSSHNYIEVYPIPTAEYNGNVYTFYYREGIIPGDNANDEPVYTSATVSTTPLPVSDMVANMLVPAITERWRMYRTETFAPEVYNHSMAVATRAMMPFEHAMTY